MEERGEIQHDRNDLQNWDGFVVQHLTAIHVNRHVNRIVVCIGKDIC